MCIINLTSSRLVDIEIDAFIKRSHANTTFMKSLISDDSYFIPRRSVPMIGAFTSAKSIQTIIKINQKFSFIIIHTIYPINITLLQTMDALTRASIQTAIDQFERIGGVRGT